MENKRSILLIVLLGVIVSSLFLITPTLAIFKSTTSGSQTINLADWSVSLNQTGINNTLNLVSGVTNQSYTVKVNSTSEVDVEYSIVISNIPEGVEVALIVPGEEKTFVEPDSNNTITFNNVGTILYSDSDKEKEHILEFKSNLETAEVSNRTVNINVIISQII